MALEETSFDYLHTPGYRLNLSPSQTLALFRLWRRFLRLCEITSHTSQSFDQQQPPSSSYSTATATSNQRSATSSSARKQRLTASEPAAAPHSLQSSASASLDHSHGSAYPPNTAHNQDPDTIPKDDRLKEHFRHLEESKEMQNFLMQHGGAALRREFWAIVKGEHPDAFMLRCLRARKWDVDRALAVIGSTCAFRVQYNVSGIMKEAELGLTKTRGGFNIMNNGISYIRGATAVGEPVYFIEVGSHYSSNQTAEELKRGVILLQESLQILMPPPVERKVIIFNLNNFGLRNMDWSIVLFMAKTMESFYPETAARIYVHGAPWIFKPIWSILRPLLDPVVRDKVHLTWKVEELAQHIPADHLPKSTMHGNLDWEFEYPPPKEDENDIQKDLQTAQELETIYKNACMEFEYATRALARAYGDVRLSDTKATGIRSKFLRHQQPSSSSSSATGAENSVGLHQDVVGEEEEDWEPEGVPSLRANRDILATKVRVAWLKLKPYVIGTLKYDRWGVTDREGVIRWDYPTVDGRCETQVLGEGTCLSALERNLAELDALSGGAVAGGGGKGSAFSNTSKPQPKKHKEVDAKNGVSSQKNSGNGVGRGTGGKIDNTQPPTTTTEAARATGAGAESSSRDSRPSAMATQTQSLLSSTDTTTEDAPFQEPIPIHPSQHKKLMQRARDADLETEGRDQGHESSKSTSG